jgi:hypothetical protein
MPINVIYLITEYIKQIVMINKLREIYENGWYLIIPMLCGWSISLLLFILII